MKLSSLILCLVFLLQWHCIGASIFTWPASNNGPYQVIGNATHTSVLVPSGAAITEGNILSHQYHHHTRISWHNGLIALAYSSCATNEADGGMQTVVSFSGNRGRTWSQPVVVVPSQSQWITTSGYFSNYVRVTYPRNFQTYVGTNYLVTAVDQYVNDGREFGDALLAAPMKADKTVGELIRISSGNYTNMNGISTPAYNATFGPDLMAYSKVYGCWGGTSPGGGVEREWIGWLWDGIGTVVEPNVFSADGGSQNLYRIWRAVGVYDTHWCVQQFSSNGGTTWGTCQTNQIPNAPSETVGRRLSDGRTVFFGNPTYYSGAGRDPLYLAITSANSTDITNVWAIRQGLSQIPTYGGWGKGGGASYVDAVQAGNYLYVSYSLQKESIAFTRLLIPGMEDNNNDYAADYDPRVSIPRNIIATGNLQWK